MGALVSGIGKRPSTNIAPTLFGPCQRKRIKCYATGLQIDILSPFSAGIVDVLLGMLRSWTMNLSMSLSRMKTMDVMQPIPYK